MLYLMSKNNYLNRVFSFHISITYKGIHQFSSNIFFIKQLQISLLINIVILRKICENGIYWISILICFSKLFFTLTLSKTAILLFLLGAPILSAFWKPAIRYLWLITCCALPISTWSSRPSVLNLSSVYHESYVIVYIFLIEPLNIVCVWVSGTKMGTYKYKLLIVTVISLAIVVNILSWKSIVLNVKWKLRFLVNFLKFLQKPNKCLSGKWPLIFPLLTSTLWLLNNLSSSDWVKYCLLM